MRHVDGYQREAQEAWIEYATALRKSYGGDQADITDIIYALQKYIDARIKLAFAEKDEYGKVVL